MNLGHHLLLLPNRVIRLETMQTYNEGPTGYLEELELKIGSHIALLTIRSLNGEKIEERKQAKCHT